MPRPKKLVPEYHYHVSGQARVYLDGRHYYLGEHNSPESRARYFALLREYDANGQRMPERTSTHQIDTPITVAAVTGEDRGYVAERFPDEGNQERNRFENLCTTLEDEYGSDPADRFGPRKLSELRDLLVASGNCRSYVNRQIRAVLPLPEGNIDPTR